MKKKTIQINGSKGSGGGQILRTSLGLSALTGKPFQIKDIRAKRCNPGLAAQHLTAVQAIKQLCNAETTNAKIGSTHLSFIPNKIQSKKPKELHIDCKTAGSVPLILQALLIPAAKYPIKATLKGGTDVRWSPTIDYFQHTFSYFAKKFNIDIQTKIKKRGFYPKGGGEIQITATPNKLTPINLTTRGDLIKINIISTASEYLEEKQVAERQANKAEQLLKEKDLGKTEKTISYTDSNSPGSSLYLEAIYKNTKLAYSTVGEKGKPAEKVAKQAVNQLLKEIKPESKPENNPKNKEECKGAVDSHATDQILPYLALAKGKISTTHISAHTKTNISKIEKFLPVKFKITNNIIEAV